MSISSHTVICGKKYLSMVLPTQQPFSFSRVSDRISHWLIQLKAQPGSRDEKCRRCRSYKVVGK